MKFAKQLGLRSIPSWAPYYMDYKSLKHYIKSSFKDLAGPLESLENVDHEDQEPTQIEKNDDQEVKITISKSIDSGSINTDQEEVSAQASKERGTNDDDAAALEANVGAIVEGFKALLWAELEKVNARYEAQERVAGVNLERLNAS
ncbi:hypothetical protein BGZ49_005056, partial [Haplosporangium sp. Z 27]